jgi:hypothetical protein
MQDSDKDEAWIESVYAYDGAGSACYQYENVQTQATINGYISHITIVWYSFRWQQV